MTAPLDQRPAQDASDGAAPLRPLSVEECWAQLRHQSEGRLGYATGRGPRHVVLPYALHDRALVLRVPAFDEAAPYAADRRVAFDVEGRPDGGGVTSVEVSGAARVLEGPTTLTDGLPDEGWPDDLRSSVLLVEVDGLRGTRRPVGPTRETRP